MAARANLRRRLHALQAALDPSAPLPAWAQRTKAAIAAARARQDLHQAVTALLEEKPGFLDLADALAGVPEASPEADEIRSKILAVLAGEDPDQVVDH